MTVFAFLLPIALTTGAVFLGIFYWALRNGQFEDLKGPAERMILNDDDGEDSES